MNTRRGATIGTNDPSRPFFTLNVKGVVYPPVSIYPPEMITLNGISNEEKTYATVAVFSMDMPDDEDHSRSARADRRSSRPTQTPLAKKDREQSAAFPRAATGSISRSSRAFHWEGFPMSW